MYRLCLLVIVSIFSCAPAKNQPYNKHVWKLPNGDIIQYFEISNGEPSFSANLFQYLSWGRKAVLEKKYLINIGGSYKALELLISNDGHVIWLKGKYAGSKKKHFVAALDLVGSVFLEYDKFKWNEDDLNRDEKILKKRIMAEKGTRVSKIN